MEKKNEKKVKKYNFVQIIKCEKCGTVAEDPGPCSKCGNKTFVALLEAREI